MTVALNCSSYFLDRSQWNLVTSGFRFAERQDSSALIMKLNVDV